MLRGGDDLISGLRSEALHVIQIGADHGELAAGHNEALIVRHADHTVGGVLHLDDNTLKNPAGHYIYPPSSSFLHHSNAK